MTVKKTISNIYENIRDDNLDQLEESLKILKEKAGVTIDWNNKNYQLQTSQDSPLHVAANFNNAKAIQKLLSYGMDINSKNLAQETAIDIVLKKVYKEDDSEKSKKLISFLLVKEASINPALKSELLNSPETKNHNYLCKMLKSKDSEIDFFLSETKDSLKISHDRTCVKTLQKPNARVEKTQIASIKPKTYEAAI
ncbi:MAG: hypothetical protein ACJAW3_001580 [Lentimonas sp.]|jgi:hypothetical protein